MRLFTRACRIYDVNTLRIEQPLAFLLDPRHLKLDAANGGIGTGHVFSGVAV